MDISELSALFERIKSQFDTNTTTGTGLACKQGFYIDCQVLKLLKPYWTNDRMDRVENETGIFFSIWIDAKSFAGNRLHYNIHALKVRKLQGYSITSRDFASAFRQAFAPFASDWPNVSVEYGPQTLMQGWLLLGPDAEKDSLSLLHRFEPLAEVIDRLLESRRR